MLELNFSVILAVMVFIAIVINASVFFIFSLFCFCMWLIKTTKGSKNVDQDKPTTGSGNS